MTEKEIESKKIRERQRKKVMRCFGCVFYNFIIFICSFSNNVVYALMKEQ